MPPAINAPAPLLERQLGRNTIPDIIRPEVIPLEPPALPPQVTKPGIIRPEVVLLEPSSLPTEALLSPLVRSLTLEEARIKSTIVAAPAQALSTALSFFGGLTATTGGRFRALSSAAPRPQQGDVTGDLCVDELDLAALRDAFGTVVPASSPLDTNQDGIVNIFDYRNVLANSGEGLGCR